MINDTFIPIYKEKKKFKRTFILSDESELQLDLTYMYIDSS